MIKLTHHTADFIENNALTAEIDRARNLLADLPNNSMAGWLDLPESYDREEFARIQAAASKIQSDSECLVCIGIGGSYLGARAVIEALPGNSKTKIIFAGNSLSPIELDTAIRAIKDRDFSINIISKSGTTLEPAIAFRIFKNMLINKYGEAEASKRIYATTDAAKGALHDEAIEKGYQMFIVPDDIGGRYSVLTPVGLLPIATAGIDISELMAGAAEQQSAGPDSAIEYASARNLLLQKDFNIEVLATFEPSLLYLNEWWKQLFGESEGKDGKGIFPASVIYTTDLHSLGQYLQDGRRALQETFIRIASAPAHDTMIVPSSTPTTDGLTYLEGKRLSFVNDQATTATIEAHLAGGVPITELTIPALDARSLGALLYFFELSCALSALLLGVNPFDQPGVEAYKHNMFRLLGRP